MKIQLRQSTLKLLEKWFAGWKALAHMLAGTTREYPYLLNCFCPGIGSGGVGSLLKVITATSLSLCQRHLQCVSHPQGFVLSYCLAGSLLSCHRKGPATDKGYYPGYHCLIRGPYG